jgi:RNA polymerase sigma-70 factor (ECF subfamily)
MRGLLVDRVLSLKRWAVENRTPGLSSGHQPVMPRDESDVPAESSTDLLDRARAGDRSALDALMARHLPRLRRWATGRLPRWARDMADTQDLVQDTLLQTFKRIDRFEVRGDGALQAYLRQGVLNRIRDEFRRASRRPANAPLDSHAADPAPSPLEEAIGREAVERYDDALQRLRAEDREAIIARIEMGFTHEELATLLGKPSANAARMALERALVRLAEEMHRLAGSEAAPREPGRRGS